jgi:hypothetical protein
MNEIIIHHLKVTQIKITTHQVNPSLRRYNEENRDRNTTSVNLVKTLINAKPLFAEILESLLSKLVNKKYQIIIIGDFNVHFNNLRNNEKTVLNVFKSFNLYPCVNFPTRNENTIHNMFTNFNKEQLNIKPLNLGITDHSRIYVEIKLSNNKIVT